MDSFATLLKKKTHYICPLTEARKSQQKTPVITYIHHATTSTKPPQLRPGSTSALTPLEGAPG